MSSIEIRKISITELDTDAIVNAANEGLLAGGGVCGAVFAAAGHDELRSACNRIGHCSTGAAVITPGFNLKAKYIIHAVGPVWQNGRNREAELLYSAYHKALELAKENHCSSIGFPLISAGIYGYPSEGAWEQALTACRDYLDRSENDSMDIVFAVLDDRILAEGKKQMRDSGFSRYRTAERTDWKNEPMPDKHVSFSLCRSFIPKEMKSLRHGNIPRAMEDKWFWYMEGDTLYAHRSWTGTCIYRIEFKADNDHLVTVNRDPEQYVCDSMEEELTRLNKLLDRWVQDPYDHYDEWISETYDALQKRKS